jgi:hypothetical protein
MADPQTPLSTLALSPNPDLEQLQDILGAMRGALGTLGVSTWNVRPIIRPC